MTTNLQNINLSTKMPTNFVNKSDNSHLKGANKIKWKITDLIIIQNKLLIILKLWKSETFAYSVYEIENLYQN